MIFGFSAGHGYESNFLGISCPLATFTCFQEPLLGSWRCPVNVRGFIALAKKSAGFVWQMASASVVLSALAKSPGGGKRLELIPWLHFGRSYSTVVPVWPNLQSLFMHWIFGHCLRIQLQSSFVKQLFTAVQNDSHHVPAVFKYSMTFFYSTLHCKLTGYSKF